MSENQYICVRHGQTPWNKNGIMHGQYDIPLNYTGREQAKKVSEKLKEDFFDICFCSPLKRAKTTAALILLHHRNTRIVYDDRLKELSKGMLEGRNFNSEKLLKDENRRFLAKFGIESKVDFFARVKSFIDEVERDYFDKRMLIVSHSGTMKMIYFYFNPPNIPLHKAYYQIHIENCKVYNMNKFSL